MLDVMHASKTFLKGTAGEKVALDHMDLHLDDGEFVTVLGSNGAGKSTLFNAVCGGFLLDSGRIVLDGQDITFLPEHKRARMIGRVFQDPMKGTAPHMTIEENLAIAYARSHRRALAPAVDRKERDLFRASLARYHMGLEDRMKTKVGQLSGGQRQAVTLLMCTLSVPKLLLLDEHTAALDPATAEKVMDITRAVVAENRITTMMITHNMASALKTGTRTIMLDAGRIILDLSGEERARLTLDDLRALYTEKKKQELDNDRMLLE
jgi:putative ABC transport system ATP-binding protein